MIHKNSRESYNQCKVDGKYKKIIYRIAKFFDDNRSDRYTDRQVKELMFKKYLIPENDMNMVRPKITKLIKDGLLREDGTVVDDKTSREVRLVRWAFEEKGLF